MTTKLFELRDRSTFIPIVCLSTEQSDNDSENYLLRRSGYAMASPCIILCKLECSGIDRNASYDAFAWGINPRTYNVAHRYIEEHWYDLQTGDVIDVEFILGETQTKKVSEREEAL